MSNSILNIGFIAGIPKYKQIAEVIKDNINSGDIKMKDKLPSINQISKNNGLSKETVVKAFQILSEEGVLEPVHGKGFYVKKAKLRAQEHVFLLLDTFAPYKWKMYNAILNSFGDKATVDVFFHHFNFQVFKNTIKEHIGKYTSYIILPFENKQLEKALSVIPQNKMYLIDRQPHNFKGEYCGVFQDFKSSIYNSLQSVPGIAQKYDEIILLFRDSLTQPPQELIEGLKDFCKEQPMEFSIQNKFNREKLQKKQLYIAIDDEDLANIVIATREDNLIPGKTIGIISYNDTPMKKVIGNGISVISTDFEEMGKRIAQKVLKKNCSQEINPSGFINRGSV